MIWARREAALEALRANKLLVAVVLFCQASILWSNYPDLTLRRALLLLFVTAISLGLAASIDDLRRFHTRLFQTLVFVILVNLAATALWPDLAVTDIGVAGIYGQKNPAGMVAMIVTVVCVTYGFGATARHRAGSGRARRRAQPVLSGHHPQQDLDRPDFPGARRRLACSGSCNDWAFVSRSWRWPALPRCWRDSSASSAVSDFDVQRVLGAFVADTSFTGRDELWGFAWRSALERPWLGHGYGAFWDVGAVNDPLVKLEPGTWLGDVKVGIINQAHDGYLELFLHIGIPMTLVAVASVFVALGAATRRAITTRGGAGVQAAYAMMALVLLLICCTISPRRR